MKIQIEGPDGKKYEIEGDGDPGALADRFGAEMGWRKAAAPAMPAAPPETNVPGNTAAIVAGGFQKGAREGGNPLHLIAGLSPALASMPVQAAALKSLGLDVKDIPAWAKRNAPKMDPILAWQGNPVARNALKDVAGYDPATDLKDTESAYKATGAEKTPLRQFLAGGAEIVGSQLPFIGAGPVGPGLKLAGASAALGGLGNAVAGDTGKTIGALAALPLALRGRVAKPPAPQTTDELKAAATAAYKKSEDAGVIIEKNSFAKAVNDIETTLKGEGFHPKVETRLAAAMESLKQPVGEHVTLEGAATLRKIITKGFGSLDKNERRLTHIVLDKFDDYIGGLKNTDVIAGDAKAATEALTEARGLWSRMSKSDTVERLVKKAEDRASNFTGSGKENAIRREFVKLVSNDAAMRKFTEAERDALRRIAKGGSMDNLLRFVGRGAPKGAIMQGAHVASILSNPLLGIPLAGVTALARKGATTATERNARFAAELMRRGKPLPPSLRKYAGAGAVPGAIGARLSEQ